MVSALGLRFTFTFSVYFFPYFRIMFTGAADSFIESRCPSVRLFDVFSRVVYFEAYYAPLTEVGVLKI